MAISNQVAPELKLSAVREYLGGNGSLNKIAEKYGVCRSTRGPAKFRVNDKT